MRFINLTQGQVAIVDDDLYDWLMSWNWRAQFDRKVRKFYAVRSVGVRKSENGKYQTIGMHREIIGAKDGEIVDHINCDPIDNRRVNLRIVTQRQSNLNTRLLRANNTSGFRGVYWHAHRKKWVASIRVNNQSLSLGYYQTAEQAAKSYDTAALKYHGGFSPLNFPGGSRHQEKVSRGPLFPKAKKETVAK